MKKLILTACLLALGAGSALAQQKEGFALGLNVPYQTKDKHWGFGLKARFGITESFRFEANVNHYLPKEVGWGKTLSHTEFVGNLHYVLPLGGKFSVYPLAGVGYMKTMISQQAVPNYIESNHQEVFVNAGAGASYNLTRRLSLGLECRYLFVKDRSTPVASANLMFAL